MTYIDDFSMIIINALEEENRIGWLLKNFLGAEYIEIRKPEEVK